MTFVKVGAWKAVFFLGGQMKLQFGMFRDTV